MWSRARRRSRPRAEALTGEGSLNLEDPTPELAPVADPEATLPGAGAGAGAACATCGSPRNDLYCSRCGQVYRPGRIKLRREVGWFFSAAFDLDRGLLHTFLQLCRRPARVVSDYLHGKTVLYTHPGKYFLLVLALLQIVAYWTGAVGEFTAGLTEESDLVTESQVSAAIDGFFVLLAGPAVLLLAWLQKRVFRHAHLYYAEHLVFSLFVTAQQALIWTGILVFSHLVPAPYPFLLPLLAFAATTGYYVWSAHRLFGGRLTANAGRSLLVLALTPLLYVLLVTILIGLLKAAFGA